MTTSTAATPRHHRATSHLAPVALLSPAVGSFNIGDHLIELAIRRLLPREHEFIRFSIREPLGNDEIARINQASCAVVCGTNLYQWHWEAALDRRTLDRITVPIIPFGMGASAANLDQVRVGHQTRTMIRALHERCVLGGVRDPYTLAVVREAGVSNAVLTGCPVLQWRSPEPIPAAMPRPRSKLVVTARNWLMHRGRNGSVNHPKQIEFLAGILHAFPDLRVTFAAHEPVDLVLVDLLRIPRSQVVSGTNLQQYIDIYTDPENVVLAMRLHAGMLSVANGVPTVFVNHDTRSYSFCQMMGMEYIQLFDDDAADAAITRLRWLLDGNVPPSRDVARTHAMLQAGMRRFLDANGLPSTP